MKLFSCTFKKVRDFFVFGARAVWLDTTGCQLLGNTRKRQSGGVSMLILTPNYMSQLLKLPFFKTTKVTEDVNTGVKTHQALRQI